LNQLTTLKELWLDNNQISEIESINQLKQLDILDFENNKIEDLSKVQTYLKANKSELVWKDRFYIGFDKGINLYKNPIKNPPIDVVQQGKAAILRYFEEIEKGKADYLHEARLLIVGQGEAGKTSLKTKLLDVENPMPAKGDTTRGIEIDTLTFKMADGQDFDLRIWDFGGQNIQHYAHQFFLSDSSLYALVHNQRKENTNFTYWLNIIEMLGKESPVIIVQNEVEEHSEPLKNIVAIRDRYPNVESVDKDKGTHQVNIKEAKTDKRFTALKAHIQKIASDPEKLPHLKKLRPESFIRVRDKIDELAKEHYFIEWKEYIAICNDAKATDVELQKDYSITMSKLGTCLHFPKDSDLKDYVFLNPKWIIDALFLLLYNQKVIDEKGKFCEQDCDAIWEDERYNGMHSKLIRLMENFELCYKINDYDAKNRNYLVPQRLPASTASFNWKKEEIVRVRYQYEFIPSGILTRLTCRLHTDIDEENVWSDAVVFTNNKKDAHVYIKERFAADELWIEAKGVKRSELLNKVVEELDKIHINTQLANLQVKKMLPCNCRLCQSNDDPFLLEYEVLLRRLKQQIPILCNKSDERIDIEKLIADTFEGGDKALIKLNAMHYNMTSRFDRVENRFDSLEDQLGEFKFLIENLNEDSKEATQLILNDLKDTKAEDLGSAKENQLLINKMLAIIEQNENYNAEQKAKVKQELNRSDVEVKHKLIVGTPGILDFLSPFSYKGELSVSNKQKLPKNWKELKALLWESKV